MDHNDITVRPAKHEVIMSDSSVYNYGSTSKRTNTNRVTILRASTGNVTLWPNEFIEVNVPPEHFTKDSTIAVEPRVYTNMSKTTEWLKPDLYT